MKLDVIMHVVQLAISSHIQSAFEAFFLMDIDGYQPAKQKNCYLRETRIWIQIYFYAIFE